jgi:hypothetical protein
VEVSLWIYKEIDKLRRAFIWTGLRTMNSGQCKVAWACVTHPQELGGLGVLDLTTLGYALRMHWAWLARTDLGQSWSALPTKDERLVRAMFEASTIV